MTEAKAIPTQGEVNGTPAPKREESNDSNEGDTTDPTPTFDVSVLDQVAMLTQSLALEIHADNLKTNLGEYLSVSKLQAAFARTNPDPKKSSWTVVDDFIILHSGIPFDFAHAAQLCLTLKGSLFGPRTDAHVDHILSETDQPIWVPIEKLRGSDDFYVYSPTEGLPSNLKDTTVTYAITGEPTCVVFDTTLMKFKTDTCSKSFHVFCTLPMDALNKYQDHLTTQEFLLSTLTDLIQWFEDLGGTALLSDDGLPIASCSNSIPVFSTPYPPLSDSRDFSTLTLGLTRFLQKFNWIQKLLHGLKLLRSHRVLSTLGFSLNATPTGNLCISWNFPVFPAWSKNLFSFSITDICLAVATMSVALLSGCLTYRAFKHRSSPPHHHYSHTPTPPPSPSAMSLPLRSARVTFSEPDIYNYSPHQHRHSPSPPPSPASSVGALKYYPR